MEREREEREKGGGEEREGGRERYYGYLLLCAQDGASGTCLCGAKQSFRIALVFML